MRVLVCVPACSPRPCCVPVHWAPGVPALLTVSFDPNAAPIRLYWLGLAGS